MATLHECFKQKETKKSARENGNWNAVGFWNWSNEEMRKKNICVCQSAQQIWHVNWS